MLDKETRHKVLEDIAATFQEHELLPNDAIYVLIEYMQAISLANVSLYDIDGKAVMKAVYDALEDTKVPEGESAGNDDGQAVKEIEVDAALAAFADLMVIGEA